MTEVYEYTSPQEMRQNFAQIYHKEVKPMMEEFEKIRVQKYKEIKIIAACAIVIWLAITFFSAGILAVHSGFFVLVIAVVIISVKKHNFTKLMKDSCMPRFMKAFGNLTHYVGEEVISDAEIGRTKLFKTYNRRTNDDAFIGSYKGVEFKISETYLAYETGGKNKSTYVRFKGVLIDFESNKTIKNTTIIQPNLFSDKESFNSILALVCFLIFGGYIWFLIGAFSVVIAGIICVIMFIFAFLAKPKRVEVLNPMQLEDPDFQKNYVASSSDEVEGRYLITTAFIQRFKDLKKAFKTNQICCSFYDKNLMFGIWSDKDLFEIGKISKPLTNAKYIEQFYNQMIAILQIIEQFKLDEKTGL